MKCKVIDPPVDHIEVAAVLTYFEMCCYYELIVIWPNVKTTC